MACFPKIDQPCPLGIDAQRRINGYCGHCSKAVHSLDAMSDAERLGFLRNAGGPVCVSYRAPRAAALGLGAALVLSMAAPGHADPIGSDANVVQAATAQTVAPPPPEQPPVMMMGGVSDPASAALIDEDDAPELPVVHEATAART